MTTQTVEKIYREIKALKQETKNLKKLFFLILQDDEGEYKSLFIKRILKKSRLKPQFIFTNKKEFFKRISY